MLYEAIKKVLELRKAIKDMHVAAERSAAEFARLTDSQKLANDELRVTSDHLENAIAKLAAQAREQSETRNRRGGGRGGDHLAGASR